MLCVRTKKRAGRYRPDLGFSNHSWGTAIDIMINGKRDEQGDKCTMSVLYELYPYFHKAGFYWGGGYQNVEDSMHFEVSQQLLDKWKNQKLIP